MMAILAKLATDVDRLSMEAKNPKGGNRTSLSDYQMAEILIHAKNYISIDDICTRLDVTQKQRKNVVTNNFENIADRNRNMRIANEVGYVFPTTD
jgi:hypothetical protein